MRELDDPVVVELPLRGEWTVERSPADRIPSHGTDLLGPWYAYDLVRTDHRPVRESWVALETTVGFAQGGLDPARLAGNHVIVATGGTYALYAHLAPGSVVVSRGQRVRVGEMLGWVGHSGNSTAHTCIFI
jgi:hypothetical protein